MPLLPGFIGHSVADRKMIEGRKAFAARLGESDEKACCVDLTAHDLQIKMDQWAAVKYAHEGHGGLEGKTPFARAQESPGSIRHIANLHALDLLLAPAGGGWRQVTKKGIRLDEAYYFSGALLPGRRVFCRQDPEDMGRLYVFSDEHGEFIAEAICPRRAGIDPRKAIAMAREEQAALIKKGNAKVRAAAHAIKPRDMIDAVLDLAGRKSAAVTAFPRPSEPHCTGALAQAAVATGGERPATSLPAISDDSSTSNVLALPETPKARFRRAMAIRDALAGGESPSAEDVRWLGGYETSAEFKSHASLLAEHGREWLNA
jgi:hypothetical protein